jgi:hypothetical protein
MVLTSLLRCFNSGPAAAAAASGGPVALVFFGEVLAGGVSLLFGRRAGCDTASRPINETVSGGFQKRAVSGYSRGGIRGGQSRGLFWANNTEKNLGTLEETEHI